MHSVAQLFEDCSIYIYFHECNLEQTEEYLFRAYTQKADIELVIIISKKSL